MTASCGMRRTPPGRPESASFSWCFVGISLVALALQLPTSFGKCVSLPVYESMKLRGHPKRSYAPGERIYFDCKPGFYYSLYLTRNTFCKKDGTWHRIEEACHKEGCNTQELKNGQVIYPQGGTEFDKEVHFYCDYGYYLIGKQILTCKFVEGKVFWDDDPPICEKVKCKTPEKIENGKYSNGHKDTFVYNEVINYSCDSPNGTNKYLLIGESRLICMGTGRWSTDPPQCKEVKCDIPVLKHGRSVSEMKEKYFYEDVVEFECLEGFLLNGNKSVFCGKNNTWEPEMPTCIEGIKPTTPHSTKLPALKYPDPGISVLMLLTLLIVILVTCICLCQFLRRRKKRLEHPPSVPEFPVKPSFSVGASSEPPPTTPAALPPSLPAKPPPEVPVGPPPGVPIGPPPGIPVGPPPGVPVGPPS